MLTSSFPLSYLIVYYTMQNLSVTTRFAGFIKIIVIDFTKKRHRKLKAYGVEGLYSVICLYRLTIRQRTSLKS